VANGNGRKGIDKLPSLVGFRLYRTPVGVMSGLILFRLVAFWAIELCPRAVAVLRRQLTLDRDLRSRGRIDRDQLFFSAKGPIRTLAHLTKCWRKSSLRLGLRYRRPYCARHTSLSWNLMSGKNPLPVSAQHGHSLTTMFRTYAACVRGATETDVAMIQSAMNLKKSVADYTCSQEARFAKGPMAGLGTRLATGRKLPRLT
jgi:hypothetical protein